MLAILVTPIFSIITLISNIITKVIFSTTAYFVVMIIHAFKVPGEATMGMLEQAAAAIRTVLETAFDLIFNLITTVLSAFVDAIKDAIVESIVSGSSAIAEIIDQTKSSFEGTDVAGEVVQIGSAVNKFKDGDKVIAMLSHATGGALAEYAVAKEKLIVARPPQVSAPEGAGLPLAALTAHTALTLANIPLDGTSNETKNVLITAVSGGVGHYAVQLAKLGNTYVTATCGARNLDLVKDLGANEVLDYKTPEGASLKSPSGKKYDCVVHCASGIPWATFKSNLSETGKVIDLTPGLSSMATFVMQKLTFSKQEVVPVLFPNTRSFECVVNLANEGKVKTVIDSKYSMNSAVDAWSRIMSGHATGKIVIEF